MRGAAIALALAMLAAPAADARADATHTAADYVPFFPTGRDAAADVDAALATAAADGRHILLIFGGDWCHDSRALADVLRQPRTAAMLATRYIVVPVAVPRSLDQRSIAVAHRFGLGDIVGTPTVLIVRRDGTPVNLADAPRWRNAADRSARAVHRALERAVPAPGR